MAKIRFTFEKGIFQPPTLGTAKLRLAPKGYIGYGQNFDVSSDEYGEGIVVPGPSVLPIAGNSELTGVPIILAKLSYVSSGNKCYIYFAEGASGAANVYRRIKNVVGGGTPTIETPENNTIAHSGHSSLVIHDMEPCYIYGHKRIYIVAVDANDVTIHYINDADSAVAPYTLLNTISGADITNKFHLIRGDDGLLYSCYYNKVDSYDPENSDALVSDNFTIPRNYGITTVGKWQGYLVLAYSTSFPFDIDRRLSSGRCGLLLWNYADKKPTRDIPVNNIYISAIGQHPSGDLIFFAGTKEGKTTVYLYNGAGSTALYSYIGEPPRNRHSIEFDSQGRVVWQTLDGQICRLDIRTRVFEHLASITTSGDAGGVLTSLLGDGNFDFFAASGGGGAYTGKTITLGNYVGDADPANDTALTPLIVSGLVNLPPNTIINTVEIGLQAAMASGDLIQVRLYKNGSTTPAKTYTMSYAAFGAVAAHLFREQITKYDNVAVGAAWKVTNNVATVAGVAYIELDISSTQQDSNK